MAPDLSTLDSDSLKSKQKDKFAHKLDTDAFGGLVTQIEEKKKVLCYCVLTGKDNNENDSNIYEKELKVPKVT